MTASTIRTAPRGAKVAPLLGAFVLGCRTFGNAQREPLARSRELVAELALGARQAPSELLAELEALDGEPITIESLVSEHVVVGFAWLSVVVMHR